MLKITRIEEDAASITLRLEGRILGRWVAELQRECEKCVARRRNVILDVSGVSFADGPGIRVLEALIGEGIRLTGASLFLTTLMRKAGNGGDKAGELGG